MAKIINNTLNNNNSCNNNFKYCFNQFYYDCKHLIVLIIVECRLGLVQSATQVSGGLKVHLNTENKRNVLVLKFRLTWVFMFFKLKKKKKEMAKFFKLAIKNIYPNYQHYTDIDPSVNTWLHISGTVKICSSYQ
jgi:hypothetical protein